MPPRLYGRQPHRDAKAAPSQVLKARDAMWNAFKPPCSELSGLNESACAQYTELVSVTFERVPHAYGRYFLFEHSWSWMHTKKNTTALWFAEPKLQIKIRGLSPRRFLNACSLCTEIMQSCMMELSAIGHDIEKPWNIDAPDGSSHTAGFRALMKYRHRMQDSASHRLESHWDRGFLPAKQRHVGSQWSHSELLISTRRKCRRRLRPTEFGGAWA